MAGSIPDNFWLEWHPTRSVLDDVPEDGWMFLTGAFRELDVGHGFVRSVGRVEAGRLLAVVDNRDRNLDPTNRQSSWWPNLGPMRHVRVMVTSGGTDYVLWRGFTTSFDPQWAINDAWVVIEGFDSLYAAARVIADSVLSTAIAATDPDIWLPLNDGGAATVQGLGRSPEGQSTATAKGEAVLPYAETTSTKFPYAGTSRADLVLPGGSFQVNPAGFSVMGVFASTNDADQVILSAGPQPVGAGAGGAGAAATGDVALSVDAGGNYSLRVGNAGGSSRLQFPQPNLDVATMVLGRHDAVNTSLTANLGLRGLGGNTLPNALIGGTWAPRAGLVRVGAGLDAAIASPFLGSLSHVALWQRYLTDAEHNALFSAFLGRAAFDIIDPGSGWQSSRVHQVIGWVLDRLGIAASRRDVATGVLRLGATATDTPAIEMMSRAAATEGGYFYADRAGNFTFRLRGHKGADRGTYDTRPGTTGHAALADLTFANDDRTFFTVAKMLVSSGGKDGQEVTYRHPNADVFGEVPYDEPTQFNTVADAHAAGVLAVGDATPAIDVTEAVIQMGAAGVDAGELLASDVLDEATVVARMPEAAPGAGPFLTWDTAPGWGGPGWGTPGPFIAWDSGPFWGAPGGWAGPGPHTQRSTILFVGHTYDRRTHAWRTRWALTPS